MPIIDEIKRKQFDEFMDQMKPDSKGLGLVQIYGLYVASVKDKNLIYSCANLRRLLNANKKVKHRLADSSSSSKAFKYMIAPKIFKYLKEDSDKGEEARTLYKNMVLYQRKSNETLDVVRKNARDIDEMNDNKKEYAYEVLKNNPEKSRNITIKELNKTINKFINTMDGAKLLALSKVKSTFDSIKVPRNKQTILDEYTREAVYTIRSAQSIKEINIYRNKFDTMVKSLKGDKHKC